MGTCSTARGLIPKRTVLLDGEIYDIPADGDRHIEFAMRLARRIMKSLDETKYFVGVQTTLRLGNHNAPSPDLDRGVGAWLGTSVA